MGQMTRIWTFVPPPRFAMAIGKYSLFATSR